MKRVISMVLALMLVLSLATTAFAATVVNETTHAYEAYQIFSGTQNAADANLAGIDWGTGVNGDALLAALKADGDVGAYFASCADANAVSLVLSDKKNPSYVVGQFAQLAYDNKTDVSTSIAANVASVDLAAGYYLIVDVTTPAEGDAKNPALLQVTNAGPIYIQKKYDVPEPDKDVIADDPGDTTDHVSHEDTPIGKDVEFHISAEMPTNLFGYREYTMIFHDDLSNGLSLNADSIQVYLDDSEEPVDAKYYDVIVELNCDRNDAQHVCDFHVVIDNTLAIPGVTAGTKIKVKYTAEVLKSALIKEQNDFRLEYSNDPNWDPDSPEMTPTGITPWKEVFVYNTEVEIRKVDGATDQPLTGAEFTLTGVSEQKVKVTKKEFKAYTSDKPVEENNKYWLLKDGTYTTWDPALPETDASVYVEPDAEGNYTLYYAEETSAFEPVAGDVVSVAATVGPDGTVKFGGLGEGVYTIEETDEPDGYNGLEGTITLTIVFHEATGKWEYTWTGLPSGSGSGNSIQIENFKGSVLPETGGMGTTIFYIIGGLMVAASAVLLVTKKRMSAE